MPAENSTKQTQLQWLIEAIQHPRASDCILWPFAMVDEDHALVRVEGKKVLARRLAYKLHHGHYPEPQGISTCQDLRCINPLHIKPGDKWENGRIRAAKQNTNWQWLINQIATRTDLKVCWEWPFSRNKSGYGQLVIPGTNTRVLAHRAAFFIANKRWPSEDALHKCDNPPCFNPYCLTEGNHLANMRDMVAKGRHRYPVGSNCPFHKLTEKDVRTMRHMFDVEEATTGELAELFEVSKSTVKGIVRRITWKHLP
jgi:hypothetical protein